MSSGLKDKLFWRGAGELNAGNLKIHCFSRAAGTAAVWVSLCGRHEITKTRGQGIKRPPPHSRCGQCDGAEMARRGWEESGPTSKDWMR